MRNVYQLDTGLKSSELICNFRQGMGLIARKPDFVAYKQ